MTKLKIVNAILQSAELWKYIKMFNNKTILVTGGTGSLGKDL